MGNVRQEERLYRQTEALVRAEEEQNFTHYAGRACPGSLPLTDEERGAWAAYWDRYHELRASGISDQEELVDTLDREGLTGPAVAVSKRRGHECPIMGPPPSAQELTPPGTTPGESITRRTT